MESLAGPKRFLLVIDLKLVIYARTVKELLAAAENWLNGNRNVDVGAIPCRAIAPVHLSEILHV